MFAGLPSPTRLLDAPRVAVRAVSTVTGNVAGVAAAAATAVPGLQTARLTEAPLRAAAGARGRAAREMSTAARALADLHPARIRRRVWAGHGRAHIEVRGMSGSGPRHRRVAASVTRRLNGLSGVRWAEVNAVTGQVLVAFDERRVDVGTLLETVRAVEKAQGTREEDFPWTRPVHPADPMLVASAAVEFAADCAAVTAALVGQTLRLPTVPRGVRAAFALVEIEKPLRRQLKRRIGPIGTDVVLALTSAAITGLSQNPGTPAVDALYRFELLVEALSRRAVWQRRESELCAAADLVPNEASERPPRPKPRPKGPIEEWSERLGPAALASGASVLALTRRPGQAAEAILVAVPKAAKVGRDGFAATTGTRLARAGVLPLNGAAFRRLDRISAVVVDSSVLCTPRLQVVAAEAVPGESDAAVWQAANRLVREHSVHILDAGTVIRDGGLSLSADRSRDGASPGAVRLVLRRGRRRLGAVTVARELDPHADAVLDAASECGTRVLLTEDAGVAELLQRADDVLPADEALVDAVRRLQGDGHGVLVVSGSDDLALAAADVGVAVLGAPNENGTPVCWSADLLCGPGLVDVWRILRAASAARPVSERAVQLAQAGSALGTLLALVGGRRGGGSHAIAPVYIAALLALLVGTSTGLRATGGPPPAPVGHVPWHALNPVDVVAVLDRASAAEGRPEPRRRAVLDPRALARAVRGLGNAPVLGEMLSPARRAATLLRASREELRDPLTPVLAVGALASAIVGSGVDAVLVGAVMTGNAVVSGVQRTRAEGALRSLLMEQEPSARRLPRSRSRMAMEAVEDMSGVPHEVVRAGQLAPGDIIALQASDVVPADARLLAATDLEVDESTLTGESLPVSKDVPATPAAPLAERRCMVFEGTTVLAGSAHAIVVATGNATEAGKAARAGGRAAPAAGIQARLAEVTRTALPVTGIGGAAVTGLGVLRGLPLREAVSAGISIAVAAVPEGLPLVATVAQASAARRLSRGGVLVRSSRTLEALGRVDTICFDKTGTLTEGRLVVARLATVEHDLDDDDPAARRLLVTAARACPPADPDALQKVPHATDRAVLEAAARSDGTLDGWEPLQEVPFETNRGYAATLGRSGNGTTLAVKGAPEVVLPLCGTSADGAQARRAADRLAAEGLRVIAVAERQDVGSGSEQDVEGLVDGLTLRGFVGIADRPRDDAVEAVRRLSDDGLRVVMVTGDHPLTAKAIARVVGIPDDDVVTGSDLERMTENQRVRRVAEASVFARVSPEQKVRIVEALRASGSVVAMTGDGTNDAAAIRLADVGIGVAASGSTSARSAADLVLTDADVTRIHEALLEGRALWRRVRDAVSILVGGNAGEVAFMVLGTALSGRAPINVRQMLLVNMLTDMFPALAVAVAQSPEAPAGGNGAEGSDAYDGAGAPVTAALRGGLASTVAVRGTATALGATSAWAVGRWTGFPRRASSMGLAALVGTQLGQTLLMGRHSRLVVLTSLASAAVLFAAVETPGVSQFFGCTPIGPVAWGVVLACSAGGTLAAALAPRVLAAVLPAAATELA